MEWKGMSLHCLETCCSRLSGNSCVPLDPIQVLPRVPLVPPAVDLVRGSVVS